MHGDVDAADFRAFRGALGSTNPVFDLDGDGQVALADFMIFRSQYGFSV
jgi:hypothetical protein